MSRGPEERRLTIYRRWVSAFVGLTTYLLLIIVVGYRSQLHDPAFVLPNIAVLLAWWGVFTGMAVAWDRLKSVRRRCSA